MDYDPESPTFEPFPILYRRSDTFGEVALHAPETDPDKWATLPWLVSVTLPSERGWFVRPDAAWEAWQHVALIGPHWEFDFKDVDPT